MINKVWDYIQKYQMLQEDDYIVAGVSGGADSVCLLLMLIELQRKLSFSIHVVHINHGIRMEAGQDAAYVENLCKEFAIPFTLVEKNVEELARKEHISTEEAGRKVRYEAFEEVLKKFAPRGKGKIAIAHNQSDCAETFLWNLFRGSGVKGLTGISPVRDQIIRPIMCLTREEIEQYLAEKNRQFCIDCTNLENNYTRNKIRNQILPFVEKEVCNQAIAHITEACTKMQEVNELLQDLTKEAYSKCVRTDETGIHLLYDEWNQIHPTVRSYVIRELLGNAAGSRKDMENIHVEQIIGLLSKQCGREIALPYGLVAVREYEGICVSKKGSVQESFIYELTRDDYQKLETGEEICIKMPSGDRVCFRVFSVACALSVAKKANIEKIIPVKPYTKWFNYDTIKDNIVIRNRQTGDYLTMSAECQHKSLKSILIDDKIPKQQRDSLILLAEENHILWIVGSRISSYYKVNADTQRILEVIYEGGVSNG